MQIFKNFCLLFKKKISLVVIFVEYDRQKCNGSDDIFYTLKGYLASITNCHTTYLRVDNKNEANGIENIDKEIYTVGGDNSFREFSGWQKGINTIDALNLKCDLVLLTNEMFLKPGPSFLQDYSTKNLLQRCLDQNEIIGRIDATGQKYSVFGYDVSSWVCTNAFFIPKQALDLLQSLVLIDDNIHHILPRDYSSRHRLHKRILNPTDLEEGIFSIDINIQDNSKKEIRFTLDVIPTDERHATNPPPPLSILLTEVRFNGVACSESNFIRGIYNNSSGKWQASHSGLLSLPNIPGNLIIKGKISNGNRNKPPSFSVQISIYNDSYLYRDNAPININYQRWLVEWLTERWHSKFTINADTWELFKTKASAIINESLLTAKLSELGYSPESYGDKQYY